jgi:hypothetical protein
LSVRQVTSGREERGFSQNLSARGVFLYTDFALSSGSVVEVSLRMPAEITMSESMRVRCGGRVLRVQATGAGTKYGVAVHLETYEYLNDDDNALISVSVTKDDEAAGARNVLS